MKFVSVTGFFMAGLSLLSAVSLGGCKSREYGDDSVSGTESIVDAKGNYLDLEPTGRQDNSYVFKYCQYKNGAVIKDTCEDTFLLKDGKQALVYPVQIDKSVARAWLNTKGYGKVILSAVGGATLVVLGAAAVAEGVGGLSPSSVQKLAVGGAEKAAMTKTVAGLTIGTGIPLVGIGVFGTVSSFVWGLGRGDCELAASKTFDAVFNTDAQQNQKPEVVGDLGEILPSLASTLGSDFVVNPKVETKIKQSK